jgi:hypothetical protein
MYIYGQDFDHTLKLPYITCPLGYLHRADVPGREALVLVLLELLKGAEELICRHSRTFWAGLTQVEQRQVALFNLISL